MKPRLVWSQSAQDVLANRWREEQAKAIGRLWADLDLLDAKLKRLLGPRSLPPVDNGPDAA